MEEVIAVKFERKEIDSNKIVFIPCGIIKLKDSEKLIGIDDVQYHYILEENVDNYIFFPIEMSSLKTLYKENYEDSYLNDIKKYTIIYNKDNIELLYSNEGQNEIIPLENFPEFFVKHYQNEGETFNIKDLYNELKNNIFMQDEAIKKIIVALALHYMDSEEKEKVNIIIDGDKGTGKTSIVNIIKESMPCSVIVQDIGDENFSFDYLFLSLHNNKKISECPILVLDNADKLLLNNDLQIADNSIDIIKKLMLGVDFLLQTSSGAISYPTRDFVIIVVGDFKKRLRCGINNYVEGVPDKISRLTNYNVKMNPMSKEMVYLKLLNQYNGTLNHYIKYFNEAGISVNISDKFINKIVCEVMKSNMHELDKIVEKCFEDVLFDLYTSDSKFQELTIDHKILNNSKKYILK